MAKKKAAAKKGTEGKQKRKSAKPAKGSTIKPPPAPPLLHCAEVGAPLSQDQAIRERLRLYPRATTKEIIAMFELEGLKITPEAVKKAKGETR
ncbi:MAG TPA: hypothetical protein VHC22_30945 [Pirellulales bacterium]|nr:hypothetical protein [Pirellulales bacterium]